MSLECSRAPVRSCYAPDLHHVATIRRGAEELRIGLLVHDRRRTV